MWSVYNSIKSWTLYGLNLREVQLLVNSMSINEIKLSKVTADAGLNWQNLTVQNFPHFFSNTGKDQLNCLTYQPDEVQLDHDTDFFIIKPKREHLARLHKRFEMAFKVILEGQSKSFESVTIDISEGGIYFKDSIPDWVSGYFVVRIYSAINSYQVICSLVEDQKIKQRVQIVSEDNDPHFLKYKEWLERL